jgi:hypothetical protein
MANFKDSSELDVSGFQCPLPVLKAAKKLKAMVPGVHHPPQRLKALWRSRYPCDDDFA